MSKHIQLDIPQPCHENWNKMTPSEKGRFCNACQKQVVDFTNMSDAQIATFFKKTGDSVCGRFMHDQLNRDMEIPKKRIPWIKYFFQFALPAFLIATKAKAQGNVIVKRDTTIYPLSSEVMGNLMVAKCKTEPIAIKNITGKVIDDKGIGIPYASIFVKGTTIGTMSDSSGSFNLKYSGEKEKIVLVASYVGFQSVEQEIDIKKNSEPKITLVTQPFLTGEVVITAEVVVKTSKKKKKSIPMIPNIFKDTAFNNFKIFPNPVSAGTNLNIEIKEKIKEGYYTLDLINQSGQPVYQREIWIDEEARLLNIDVPFVKAGNYFITITSKKSGKRFTEKLIIQ